jgi:SAM-dependent methyltransferase
MTLMAGNTGPRCPLCGSGGRRIMNGLFDDRFGAPGLYAVWRCRGCGLEQTWPRHTEKELGELYERYYNAGMPAQGTYGRLRERFFASGLYRLWLRWDGDISFHLRDGSGRLLDVGCNEGRGLSLFARSGFQVEGLEINEVAAAAARKRGFTVHTAPLSEFVPQEPYKVVVLSNVLEHVPDPVGMLRQAAGFLAPGGEIWLSCPNADSLWRELFGRTWVNWHVPYHLWHFSPATLNRVLQRAGLYAVNLDTFTPALWVAQSLCVALGSRARRVNRVMRSAPVATGLTLALRLLPVPLLRGRADKRGRGDCLVAIVRRQGE